MDYSVSMEYSYNGILLTNNWKEERDSNLSIWYSVLIEEYFPVGNKKKRKILVSCL